MKLMRYKLFFIFSIIVIAASSAAAQTEQSIAAARKMTFEPEKIDGKSVSVVKVVVFNFVIY